MEEGEIAHFEQFHFFPQCFPKVYFFIVLKQVYMEERVKTSSVEIESLQPLRLLQRESSCL